MFVNHGGSIRNDGKITKTWLPSSLGKRHTVGNEAPGLGFRL